VAVQCADGRVLVGPDNGLLSLAWDAAGGAELAVDVTRSPHRLEPVSATFHGRDLFAPVAAHLAAGAAAADAGTPLDVEELVTLDLPRPHTEGDTLVAHVLYLDGFGNAALDVGHDQLAGTGLTLGATIQVQVAGRTHQATYSTTFADVEPGRAIVYEDAQRHLALAVNRGDAAATLGLAPDVEVRLRAR
jgi:S-adenosylmethionine hydrolase